MNQDLETKRSYLKRSQSLDIIKYTLENFIMNEIRYPSVKELLDALNSLVGLDLKGNEFTRGFLYSAFKVEDIQAGSGNDRVKELAQKLGIDVYDAIIIRGQVYTNNTDMEISNNDNSIENMSTDSLRGLMASIALELSKRNGETNLATNIE